MKSSTFASIVAALGMMIIAQTCAVAGSKDRPLTNTKFDPSAVQVDLFVGMDDGSLAVKLIAKDAQGGNLLITNNKTEPLTVKMPEGFVGVPVLAQFDDIGGGGGGGGQGGQQGGGQQAVGGGGQQGGQQGGGQGGQGGGFFSIPPERTLRVPYKSVCLEYGKPEPRPRSNYTIVPIEKYTSDPVLTTLVKMVATGKLNTASAQAAAWHVSNKKSWQELSQMKYDRVAAADTPFFSIAQLQHAQQIVSTAASIAKETKEEPVPARDVPSRVSVR